MIRMSELGCLDGRIAPAGETCVPATDEGLLRGDGAFEVIRVYDGTPFALDRHLDRLERSAASLRLADPPRAELEDEAARILEQRGGEAFDGCLRIVLTRGGRRLLLTEPLPPTGDAIALGFVTYAPSRILDGVKSLSYAGNMLAGRLARERGFDDALLVTPHGRVLEAPTSSVFWVDQAGDVCTPPLEEHILASITRDCVMQVMTVKECPATTEDLLQAGEAFIASTTREVQPVSRIEERDFGSEPGPRTREAAAAVRAHIDQALAGVRV
jgi:branched-chain amino acid aminotransferase